MKKEKHIYFKFFFVFLFLLGFLKSIHSQEKAKVSGPREKTYKEELRSNKKIRAERKEKKRKERAEKKAVKKHHKRIQTKKVRKRMRESRKLANRHNENKSEFFLKKWLKKH